jgi:hypothetical protein
MEPLLEDGRHDGTHMTAPRSLRSTVERIEGSERLDALGSGVGRAAPPSRPASAATRSAAGGSVTPSTR